MNIVSDQCQCSQCLDKYYCQDYAMIIAMQTIAKKYLTFGSQGIQIIFQVEDCKYRELRSEAGKNE